jgi:hypothetical protein
MRKPTISSITMGRASRFSKSISALPAIKAAKKTKTTVTTACIIEVNRWEIITRGMPANVPQVPGMVGRKPVKKPVARKITKSFLRVEFIDRILEPIMKINLAFRSYG